MDEGILSETNSKEVIKSSGLFDGAEKTPGENIKPKQNQYNNDVDISKQLKNITNVNNIESIILLYTNGTFIHYKKNE